MDMPAAAPRAEGFPRYAPADLEDEEPEPRPRRRQSDFAPSEIPDQRESSQAAGSDLEPFAVSEAEPEIEWDPEPVSLEPEPEPPPSPPPPRSLSPKQPSPQPSYRPQPPLTQPSSPRSPSPQPLSPALSYRPQPQPPAAQAASSKLAPAQRPAPSVPKQSAPAAETPGPRRPAAPRGPAAPKPPAPRPAAAPPAREAAVETEEPEEEPPPIAEQLPNSEPDKPARTGEDVRQELRDYLNGVRDKLDKGAAPPSKPGDLLDYLGKLSDYLPERDKTRFRGSNERLAMESLKAQLAGKKGLRQKIAESFRPVVPSRKEPMTRSLIVDTFSYLKDLSAWHPDKAIATAMRERIESIVVQMGSLK
jgi:hypothetical protein